MFNRSLLALSLLLTLTLTACAPKHSGKGGFVLGDYFSMRQQGVTPYVGLIQLQSNPLLADAQIVDGKTVVDEEAKKALLAEQEDVIARLHELSPDIKIITTYKMVLNAVAFVASSDLSDKISKIQGVSKVVENSNFARPKTVSLEKKLSELEISLPVKGINEHNTVTYIGADKVHRAGISGQNMKVGIIDTGIDYTHSMLGGPGTKEIYASINPNVANEYFPNQKVVGGVDFVGTDFSAGDVDIEKNIPKRDPNPIDEAGHGSHVSGTVAGIGDGVKTYSGVAPDAKLYALKVFGKEGSTSEIAVIEALEYAADTSESLDPTQKLDVVNLSLGGGYGKPKILYTEAIRNLTKGGTVVVASAGNSGDNPYIVGAPSTADEAISVAAGIDDMPQNISFPALSLTIEGKEILLEEVQAAIGTSAVDSRVSGTPVYIGNGADPIAEDVKQSVSGKIALMDRGVIPFADKLELAAKLGATGVVMVNNQEGNPFPMGGDKKVEIPGVMISKAMGAQVKEALAKKVEVVFNFSSGKIISRDDLIDTITDFSSRGPRSIDSLIKPEITGPGSNVISAAFGSGSEGVQFSGTSMSGPHIAGVMTLLKQANPTLTVAQLKAKVLNNTKIMMKGNVHVPVSLQGTGRVQVDRAFRSKVIAMPATLSLGEVSVSSNKTIAKVVTVTNLSDKDIVFSSKSMSSKNIVVNLPGSFKVKANSAAKVTVSFTLLRTAEDKANIESDGFVILTSGDGAENINLPFLAIVNKVTDIVASDFVTMTNSKVDQLGAQVNLKLLNKGQNTGDALVFNLLGTDDRRVLTPPLNLSKSSTCDLEAAGIRVINKTAANGAERRVLQVGVKLYDVLTQWQPCDISLQIDSNNDGVADLELLGIKAGYVSGVNFNVFASLLLDAKAAREIRKNYELSPKENTENYVPALVDAGEMKFYDHSDVAVIETDITKIPTDGKGNVGIKLAVSNLESDDNSDDFLGSHENKWQKINISENAFAFYDMPEVVTVNANDQETLAMKRGAGSARLLVLYPNNAGAMNDISKDKQSQILVENLLK